VLVATFGGCCGGLRSPRWWVGRCHLSPVLVVVVCVVASMVGGGDGRRGLAAAGHGGRPVGPRCGVFWLFLFIFQKSVESYMCSRHMCVKRD
jgi:hypothetical protein